MSNLEILTYPNNFLLNPTTPLENIDGKVQEMIDNMATTMYDAPGVGLAAIAKGPDRNAGREVFHVPGKQPFSLTERDAVLVFLQRLRGG